MVMRNWFGNCSVDYHKMLLYTGLTSVVKLWEMKRFSEQRTRKPNIQFGRSVLLPCASCFPSYRKQSGFSCGTLLQKCLSIPFPLPYRRFSTGKSQYGRENSGKSATNPSATLKISYVRSCTIQFRQSGSGRKYCFTILLDKRIGMRMTGFWTTIVPWRIEWCLDMKLYHFPCWQFAFVHGNIYFYICSNITFNGNVYIWFELLTCAKFSISSATKGP